MQLCNTVALLLLSYLYLGHGEEVGRQKIPVNHEGKSRGEILAIETNSELVSSNSQVQNLAAIQTPCSKDGSMCLSCRSVGMCQGGVLTEVQCRGLYPYCDSRTGSCTSERRRCKEEEKALSCPGKGYFPDPQSCRSFHVCEGDPLVSYKFSCSPLQIFDHDEKKCTRPSFRVRCTNFACFGKQGRYTPYPADHSIYTLCADAYGTTMFKCPDNQEFDESKQKCVPSCTSEDNMADTDDNACKKYYRCVKSGRKFEAVPSSCPGQRIFDPKELKCVPKSPSFKCPNELIGSAPPTTIQESNIQTTTPQSAITTASNSQKELLVGETEETFFRQTNPLNQEQGKSASVIGSVYNKEHTHHGDVLSNEPLLKETHFSKFDSTFMTTTPVLGTKTISHALPTSSDNLGAVLSMLSNENTKTDSHSPSKIVTRETDKESTNLNEDKVGTKGVSSTNSQKAQTYQVTTTALPLTEISRDSHANISPVLSMHTTQADKNTDKPEIYINKITTTKPLFGDQTYKVITEALLKATVSNVEVHMTTQTPSKEVTAKIQESSLNGHFNQVKTELKGSPVPMTIEHDEVLPSQTFNTKGSDEQLTQVRIENRKNQNLKNVNKDTDQLKPLAEETSSTAANSPQDVQKFKGSEISITKVHT